MRRWIHIVFGLAVLTAVLGVVSVALVHRAGDAAGLWRALQGALAGPRLSPVVLGAAGVGLGAGVAAWLLGRSAHGLEQRPAPALTVALGPEAALAARESMARLGARLRQQLGPDADVITLVDTLVSGAVQVGASDVHVQPAEQSCAVLLRVQGMLEPLLDIPPELQRAVVNRLEVMAQLVNYVSDRPQDGHFTARGPHGTADVRLSVLPTSHGERAVLRIARAAVEPADLTSLGLGEGTHARMLRALQNPQGLVFVTGPTGSGKTTTLYGCLGHIKRSGGGATHIATIEDPVEYNLPFLTQTQVRPEVGLSFAQGLRSILRQDPNVMMVGEIRDAETARIAVQAGLTGHLILTTVHADSAAGVFNRLIEMGVEPFLVASASLVSMSQRLVRALCPACRRPVAPSDEEAAWLERRGVELCGEVYAPGGCERCGGQGWLGRTALFEMLEVTPAVRDLITAKVPTPRIQEAAVAEGMQPLLADGVRRAEAGATTLREVLRVAG